MPADHTPWTLTARWVFPADRPPLREGFITIHDDMIVAAEPAGGRKADVDLGNTAILPGLVNAHTHLDLSDARGKCPPTPDFTTWLRQVIEHRRQQTPEQKKHAVAVGITESVQRGTTLLGDIAAEGASCEILQTASLRCVVFHEVLGLTQDRAEQCFLRANDWLRRSVEGGVESVKKNKIPTWCSGISPHAPYSVGLWLFRETSQRYQRMAVPISIHLAESSDELELLNRRQGPFVGFLKELGAWVPEELVRSNEQVIEFFQHGFPTFLWIHGNYLPPSISLGNGHTIVYCPRTHAAFGHPPHPFREFLKRGVRVVLGTDSLASNPDLDILADARFVAARHPDLPGETLLRMITLDSAIALGWSNVTGSLTPGKSADLVALPLPDREEEDPHRLVFESDLPVRRVLFRGRWVLGN